MEQNDGFGRSNWIGFAEPQPVVNEPALTVGDALVLADLHIGIGA